MAKPDPRQVRLHRERLGELVAAAREARGWSQARLGEAIAGSQSKITRIELGKGSTAVSDIERIIEELRPDAGTAEEMVRLAAAAPRGKYWTGKRGKTPKHTRRLVELEPEARTIRAVHGDRMPGLLQSDMYMWRQAGLRVDMDKMTDEISNRIERKKIFDLEQAPEIHYILSESSIRRTVRGCTATAHHQIRELLSLDEKYPKLCIRILPFDADIDFVPVDFTILEFPDRRRDLVYVEYATAAANLVKPADLSTYRELWEKLDSAALSRADSRIFSPARTKGVRPSAIRVTPAALIACARTISMSDMPYARGHPWSNSPGMPPPMRTSTSTTPWTRACTTFSSAAATAGSTTSASASER